MPPIDRSSDLPPPLGDEDLEPEIWRGPLQEETLPIDRSSDLPRVAPHLDMKI